MNESKAKMSFFKRIENFWYYHKWHVIIIAVMAIAFVLLISTLNQDSEPSDIDVLTVYSAFVSEKEIDFQEEFKDIICDSNLDGKNSVSFTDIYITPEGNSDDDSVELVKFENNISNSSSDLILLDEYNFKRFESKDYYEDLSKFIDLSQYDDENILYRNEKPVAIRLRESKILKDAEFKTDNIYAGIMFIPENSDKELLEKRENAAKILLNLAKK